MNKKIVVLTQVVDETGKIVAEEIIQEKAIEYPENISQFGLRQKEQINLMGKINQVVLDEQADFLKSTT